MRDKSDQLGGESEGLPDALSRVDWEAIPKDQREILETVLHAQFEMIRSPLLPPRILQDYNDVVPGLAEKLIEWTESESSHRRKMEQRAFEVSVGFQSRGQWFGLIVSLFGLSVSGLIVYFSRDSEAAGPAAWVATVIAIVSIGGPFAARLLASRFNRQSEPTE